MTMQDLTKKQAEENRKYETAKKIRALLDEAREATEEDADELEAAILELVSE